MAHNLSMTDKINGYRFCYSGEPGWHKLGTKISKGTTLVEAGQVADVYYDVILQPKFSYLPDSIMPVTVPEEVGIWRAPMAGDNSWCYFGSASDNYEIMETKKLFDAFGPLADKWNVETVGAIGKGDTIFFVLDAGIVEVNGDEIHQYFMVTDNKSKKQATSVVFTPIRTVCENTLISGLAASKMNVAIKHYKGVTQKIIDVASTANNMVRMMETTNEIFSNMAKIRFSVTDFQKIVEDIIYPSPILEEGENVTEAFLKMKEKAEESQMVSVELFSRLNDENSKAANTAWNAYNAITEWESHKPGKGISQYKDLYFGKRADTMTLAFNALMKK